MTTPIAAPPNGRDLLANPVKATRLPGNTTISVVLVIVALLAALLGLAQLSNATMGVGLICAGCLLAVCARIAQARYQHVQLLHVLGDRSLTT
jgi:hypothetical protein